MPKGFLLLDIDILSYNYQEKYLYPFCECLVLLIGHKMCMQASYKDTNF